MTNEEIFEKIKEILVDRLGVDESRITLETSYTDDLGADSLDLVELIMELEDAFDSEISDEEAQKISTIGKTVEFIQEKFGRQ
ncbi:acyl carrier protein [Allofustis seminis]|uniref:acyl carrier protein n=1 Tax=Allofustis seminis TaxID=166939 RepID=UPI0003600304|nr:acyl carrier protein [Allofustis seminis]